MHSNIIPGLALLSLLLCAGCTFGSIEPVRNTDSDVVMSFGVTRQDVITKANTALEDSHTSFAAIAYKHFGAVSGQEMVFPKYQIHYDATNKWHYDDIDGQYLKYWDLSAFPYEFCGIAPYAEGISVTGTTISLPSGAAGKYESQVCNNGVLTPLTINLKEPFLLAQIERNQSAESQWKDFDKFNESLLKTFTSFENGTANGTSENAEIPLPFHHLTAKVSVRLYVSDPSVTSGTSPLLESATIGISKDAYISSADSYNVTLSTTAKIFDGSFTNTVTSKDPNLIFDQTPAAKQAVSGFTTKETAYDLRCSNGVVVLPQDGITIGADFVIGGRHYSKTIGNTSNSLSWESGYHYIYYFNITDLSTSEIEVTQARLESWDNVSGTVENEITL